MTKHILNLTFHVCDIDGALLFPSWRCFAMNNELSVFMMQIVNSRYLRNIMNTHSRPPRHLLDVDSI